MQAYGGIRQDRVKVGPAVRSHRHMRALAQTGGRALERKHAPGDTSHRAPLRGAGRRAFSHAVTRACLARDTRPQTGAAYG